MREIKDLLEIVKEELVEKKYLKFTTIIRRGTYIGLCHVVNSLSDAYIISCGESNIIIRFIRAETKRNKNYDINGFVVNDNSFLFKWKPYSVKVRLNFLTRHIKKLTI